MKVKLVLLTLAVLFTGFGPLKAVDVDETLKKKMRRVLHSHPEKFGPEPQIKSMKALQKRTGLSDAQVRSYLHSLIKRVPVSDRKSKNLIEMATGVLQYYGNEDSIELLKRCILEKKYDYFRYPAILTYLNLTEHKITEPIKKIMDNKVPQARSGRGTVYKSLMRAYRKAEDNKNTDKAKRILSFLNRKIEKEQEYAYIVRLDKFLMVEKPGYASSERRRRLLKRLQRRGEKKYPEKDLSGSWVHQELQVFPVREKMRTLLSRSEGGMDFWIKSMKRLQKRAGLTDAQIRSCLHSNIHRIDRVSVSDTEFKDVVEMSIILLKHYGNKKSRELLKYVILAEQSFKTPAIRVYLHLTDHKVTKGIQRIMKDSSEQDRLIVYKYMMRGYREAKGNANTKKANRILSYLKSRVAEEQAPGLFVRLDKFLAEEKEEYASSEERRRLLKDRAQQLKKQDSNHDKSKSYIHRKVREFSQKEKTE